MPKRLGSPFSIECPCMTTYGGFVSAASAREEIWQYHKRCGGMKSHRIIDNKGQPINDGILRTKEMR